MQRQGLEVWTSVVKSLQGMSEIICRTEVEIFCLQHGLYQVEVDLVQGILQAQNIYYY